MNKHTLVVHFNYGAYFCGQKIDTFMFGRPPLQQVEKVKVSDYETEKSLLVIPVSQY